MIETFTAKEVYLPPWFHTQLHRLPYSKKVFGESLPSAGKYRGGIRYNVAVHESGGYKMAVIDGKVCILGWDNYWRVKEVVKSPREYAQVLAHCALVLDKDSAESS